MYIKKSNIRLFFGILIVVLIFFSLLVVTVLDKSKSIIDLVDAEAKYSKNLDDNFKEEIINPENIGALDIKISDQGKVLGFNLPVNSNYAFKLIREKLESNSWIYVNSGNDTQASFYKTEGEYTWLFLNCVDVSSQTSVVITCD